MSRESASNPRCTVRCSTCDRLFAAAQLLNENDVFVPALLGPQMLMLSGIADAQRRAGLIEEAAPTFEEALIAILAIDQRRNQSRLVSLIQMTIDNDRAYGVVAASPALRTRLVEAAEIVIGRLDRAEMLVAIARALPD